MRDKSIPTKAAFLRDCVFAANDGIITTFAIVAGAQGASFSTSVILIMGIANLLADGISMGAGNYLGVKSEKQYRAANGDDDDDNGTPFVHGLITLSSFVIIGLIPLISFLLHLTNAFEISIVMVFIALFTTGYIRGKYANKHSLQAAMETLLVGGFAALTAYGIGFLLDHFVV
ncbi:VIT1/CCC1 transporter family protein [Candidatus Woesebacteria bacterium]|nr:MAG: VIT1/CCC1 transporter family protein [Candidatus Woesebacteria bacterium]